MQNFSQTQLSNITAMAGLIMVIANHFKFNVTIGEVQMFLGGVLAIGGIVWNWIHRYNKGDLTPFGGRK